MTRHPTAIADDLRRLAQQMPAHADLLAEASSALYRQAATVALVKAAIKGN